MSRRLPSELRYLILQYLPLAQIARIPLPPQFWIQRIANEAEVSRDEILRVKDIHDENIVRLGAYFHVLLPGADCYVAPAEYYVSILNQASDSRTAYIADAGFYRLDNFTINYLGFRALTDKTLIDDFLFLSGHGVYFKFKDMMLLILSLDLQQSMAIYNRLHSRIDLSDIKYGITEDKVKYYHAVISGAMVTTAPDTEHEYFFLSLAAQFGREDLFSLVTNFPTNAVIEGYLKANKIANAIEQLQQMNADNIVYEILLYTDSLEFYQALEQVHSDKQYLYIRTCTYTLSWLNKKIFRYAFDKIDLKYFIDNNPYDYSEIFDGYFLDKASVDFQGFQLMWYKFLANKAILQSYLGNSDITANYHDLLANEARILFLLIR